MNLEGRFVIISIDILRMKRLVSSALSLLTSFEEACEEETEFKIIKKENGFDHFVFDHVREKCKKNRARNQITKMWSWC